MESLHVMRKSWLSALARRFFVPTRTRRAHRRLHLEPFEDRIAPDAALVHGLAWLDGTVANLLGLWGR